MKNNNSAVGSLFSPDSNNSVRSLSDSYINSLLSLKNRTDYAAYLKEDNATLIDQCTTQRDEIKQLKKEIVNLKNERTVLEMTLAELQEIIKA